MNRLILVSALFVVCTYWCSGQVCGDSSSHFQYQTLPGDSFRITKSILGNDLSKIIFGAFLEGATLKTPFVGKIRSDGTVAWANKLHSSANSSNDFVLSSIVAESGNGNIFVASVGQDPVSNPFILSIFNPDGTPLVSKTLGIASNSLAFSDNKPSLITRNGNDSMLLIFNYAASNSILDAMLLVSVSNDGNIGQSVQIFFPSSTSTFSRFQACRITNDEISLYGCAEFVDACLLNLRPQPAYEYIKINRHTGQVNDRKSYCSPPIGNSSQGFELADGDDTENTSVFLLNNGNIVFARRVWGLDPGNNEILHVFKTSTFDLNMNPIKTEYISTARSFQWFLDWDYELNIDSLGNRIVSAHDRVHQQLLFAKGDSNGLFSYQQTLSYPYTGLNHRQNIAPYQEPTFFLSSLFVASDDNHSYIDNIRILEKDTSSTCFGIHENLFFSQPASITPINWIGNFTSVPVTISENNVAFTEEDYPLQRSIVCNQTHFCNSLLLDGPSITCEQPNPVKFLAHRNSGCSMPISFSFDHGEVDSYENPDDSTLILHYSHPYRGKVIATLNGCTTVSDTVQFAITGNTALNLGSDFVYCPGKSYRLSAYSPTIESYLWQNGTTDSIFTASQPGLYYVHAKDLCGRIISDSIRIITQNFGIDLGRDTTLCTGQKFILMIPGGYADYRWQPLLQFEQQQPNIIQINPHTNTTYTIDATVLTGCIISDTINISVQSCMDYLYLPNSFTPNNDGLNDVFIPVASRTIERYELTIFNRWGQLVYISHQPTSGWSGYFQGTKQSGTFVWQCSYQFLGKSQQLQKGTVTIVN